MADRIRWGILSTGSIASTFVDDLRLLPDAEVTAVGSRTAASAERFAQAHGIDRAHGSWQALVDDPEVDAIYVATPHTAHFDGNAATCPGGIIVNCEWCTRQALGGVLPGRCTWIH